MASLPTGPAEQKKLFPNRWHRWAYYALVALVAAVFLWALRTMMS